MQGSYTHSPENPDSRKRWLNHLTFESSRRLGLGIVRQSYDCWPGAGSKKGRETGDVQTKALPMLLLPTGSENSATAHVHNPQCSMAHSLNVNYGCADGIRLLVKEPNGENSLRAGYVRHMSIFLTGSEKSTAAHVLTAENGTIPFSMSMAVVQLTRSISPPPCDVLSMQLD